MINEKDFAFGLDTEQYSSSPDAGKWMNWEVVANHKDPTVTFVFARSGQGSTYQDPLFGYNWQGIQSMDRIRQENGLSLPPVGRGVYHVLYPSESAIKQADNLFRILSYADWNHDRIAIDLELHHNQSKRTITDCTKQFSYKCKERTGRFPILYTRALWLNQNAYPVELNFMPLWLAQYKYALPIGYTAEYAPPPNPLPAGFSSWLIHQTGDRGKPIGSPVKKVMDYNRWNGGIEAVANYFGYTEPVEPPIEGDTMYIIELLGNMKIRKEPNSTSDVLGYVLTGETYHSKEEKNGWYKVDKGWISGLTPYTRITPVEVPPEEVPSLTLEERVTLLEREVFGG